MGRQPGPEFCGGSAFIYLAPSVGYNFTKKFTGGIGFIYQYARVTYQSGRSFENSIYGPTLFANYRPLENFYVATQFEYLNHDFRASSLRENNIWSPVWFIEGGMSQPIGEKGFATIGIRYNLLDNPQSPYSSAWFPVIGIYF
ncbi:MAG: hypothetical protein U5L96_17110 [Owenweeksia sp.]|nr:hypothetical protein [Owenweeksia sp.]